jgi:hypothetical protein
LIHRGLHLASYLVFLQVVLGLFELLARVLRCRACARRRLRRPRRGGRGARRRAGRAAIARERVFPLARQGLALEGPCYLCALPRPTPDQARAHVHPVSRQPGKGAERSLACARGRMHSAHWYPGGGSHTQYCAAPCTRGSARQCTHARTHAHSWHARGGRTDRKAHTHTHTYTRHTPTQIRARLCMHAYTRTDTRLTITQLTRAPSASRSARTRFSIHGDRNAARESDLVGRRVGRAELRHL